jgi:hypothetical protein
MLGSVDNPSEHIFYIQLFQLRLSPEQSGKVEYERERLLGIVEYERERLLGIANKFITRTVAKNATLCPLAGPQPAGSIPARIFRNYSRF